MPPFPEVRYYLTGLFLLIKGDQRGLRMLDLSDRGMLRSFWAFVWCLPPAILSWLWWQKIFLAGMPADTTVGPLFFARLAMLEVLDWFIPLIFAGIVCAFLGLGSRFIAITVAFNWISVPFSYAYGLVAIGFMLPLGLTGLLAMLHLALLVAMIFSIARILRQICGPQPLVVTTLLLVLIIPDMLLSEMLQRFLGVYPG